MTGVDLKRKAGELPNSDSKKPKTNGSITSFFGAPKSTSSKPLDTSPLPSLKFDKAKWASSLTSDQRDLLSLEIDTLDPSWLAHLKEEIVSKEFLELKRFLKQEKASGKTVLPPPEDIYSWSRYTPLNTVKVVIIGQDPYHNLNQAHGLCFSVRPPTTAPPSLNNMYKALKNDYPTFVPPPNRGGLLTPWAERGVLLLNTCLTVRAHEANSHANRGWEKFTGKVIEIVDKQRRGGVVFLAWGSPAGKRVAKVDRKRHNVLMSVHPSPLSAARGFFDCGHFKKTNVWLKERYGEAGVIDWDLNKKVENKPKVKVGVDAVVEEKPKIGKDELASKAVEAKDINKDPVKVSIEEATHSESKGDVANVSTDDLDLDEALLAEAEAM